MRSCSNDGGGQPKQFDTKTNNFDWANNRICWGSGTYDVRIQFLSSIEYLGIGCQTHFLFFAIGFWPLRARMKGFINQKIHSSSKLEIVQIYFIGSLILYPFGLLTYANAELDRSQASEYELVVSDKYITRNKNRNSQYIIRFDSPVGASCCFLPDESDSIMEFSME